MTQNSRSSHSAPLGSKSWNLQNRCCHIQARPGDPRSLLSSLFSRFLLLVCPQPGPGCPTCPLGPLPTQFICLSTSLLRFPRTCLIARLSPVATEPLLLAQNLCLADTQDLVGLPAFWGHHSHNQLGSFSAVAWFSGSYPFSPAKTPSPSPFSPFSHAQYLCLPQWH